MRATVGFGILAVLVAAFYFFGLPRRKASISSQNASAPVVQQDLRQAQAQPRRAHVGDILTDAQDPEFAQKVLPIVRDFLATLDRAGVNPLEGELPYNSIKMHRGPNGLTCRFLLGDSWTATTYISPGYSGIMHFGQRGTNNPFRAISHGNTNALRRLSQTAIAMPQPDAERIMNQISDAFRVDRSKFAKPDIYPEKMFDYDLGMYSVQYRNSGSDPLNQLNYPLSFSIKATSPTTAVLVSYVYDGKGGR